MEMLIKKKEMKLKIKSVIESYVAIYSYVLFETKQTKIYYFYYFL